MAAERKGATAVRTGRVVRFDETRGYGFITPDDGGEDVFVHANALGDDKWSLAPGALVEFESVSGDRGAKAMSARVIRSGADRSAGDRGPHDRGLGDRPRDWGGHDPAGGSSATVTVQRPVSSVRPEDRSEDRAEDEDGLCDVLSQREFAHEFTETLLQAMPGLTAGQVVELRRVTLTLARRHGWVEG